MTNEAKRCRVSRDSSKSRRNVRRRLCLISFRRFMGDVRCFVRLESRIAFAPVGRARSARLMRTTHRNDLFDLPVAERGSKSAKRHRVCQVAERAATLLPREALAFLP